MIRVNDRVVHNNRPGTVVEEVDRDGDVRIKFDDDGQLQYCRANEVVVVSTIPLRVTFAYNIGERVRLPGATRATYITNRKEVEDQPAYMCESAGEALFYEHEVEPAPLPVLNDDDIEDLLSMYLRRGVQYMRDEADRREFDTHRSYINVEVSGDEDNIKVEFASRYGYDNHARADRMMSSVEEAIRRKQADKDNTPKKLPYYDGGRGR